MKKQIAGLLTGLLVCSAFLTGCGKNEATEAVKESVEDENEGTGDTKDADSKKDTNKKSDKQDSDKKDENSSFCKRELIQTSSIACLKNYSCLAESLFQTRSGYVQIKIRGTIWQKESIKKGKSFILKKY